MMKKTLFVLGLSFFLAAHFSTPLLAATPASRFVVLFKNDQIPVGAAQLIGAAGGRIVKSFPSVGIVIATSGNPDFESSLAFSTPVEAVSSARFRPLPGGTTLSGGVVTPADDFFSFQWNIRRVKADKAWKITRGTHKTTVALIDTGVAWNHPDLTQNVVYAACFTSLGSCAWKSPVETCPCTPYPDLDPHGTAVASVIAASSAGGRMVGVGPGLGIASYNVFELIAPDGIPQEFSYDDSVWSAMFDAAERGYRVMNISLGDPLFDRTDDKTIIAAWTRVVKEILRKNVTIVASAGNNGLKLTGQTVHIPSDLPGVISVGATGVRPAPVYPLEGSYDVTAFYSNYGRPIDLVAPGGDYGTDDLSDVPPNWHEYGVLSAFVCPGCSFTADSSPVLGYTSLDADPGCIANASCQTDYTWFIGTSLAAPHVSAVAGLIIDRFPYFNNLIVTTILKTSAERLGDHAHFGSGMVDANRAVGGR